MTRARLVDVQRRKEAANQMYASKDYAAAAAAFDSIASTCPIYSALYSNMAAALAQAKQHAKAVAACDVALRLDPLYEKASQRRAMSVRKLEKSAQV